MNKSTKLQELINKNFDAYEKLNSCKFVKFYHQEFEKTYNLLHELEKNNWIDFDTFDMFENAFLYNEIRLLEFIDKCDNVKVDLDTNKNNLASITKKNEELKTELAICKKALKIATSDIKTLGNIALQDSRYDVSDCTYDSYLQSAKEELEKGGCKHD